MILRKIRQVKSGVETLHSATTFMGKLLTKGLCYTFQRTSGPSMGNFNRTLNWLIDDSERIVSTATTGGNLTVNTNRCRYLDMDGGTIYRNQGIYFYVTSTSQVVDKGDVITTTSITVLKRDKVKFLELLREIEDRPSDYGYISAGRGRRSTPVRRVHGTAQQYIDPVVYKQVTDIIDNFIERRKEAHTSQLPYKETILLYGPPGTGKTSLVRHLTARYRAHTEKIALNTYPVEEATTVYTGKGLFFHLFEDIDRTSEICKRIPGDPEQLTSSNLQETFMNYLDGVEEPYNLINFLTCNNAEKLTDALLRGGRCDHKIYLGYLTPELFCQFCEWGIDGTFIKVVEEVIGLDKLTASMVTSLKPSKTEEQLRTKLDEFKIRDGEQSF